MSPETEAKPVEQNGSSRRFFPDFAFLEALVAVALLVGLVLLAALTKPPLQAVAGPSVSGYVPRPEWYFLWLFQLLKYFKGSLEAVGTWCPRSSSRSWWRCRSSTAASRRHGGY